MHHLEILRDGERYELRDWVVMPNHIHVIVRPLNGCTLSAVLQSWKLKIAREANRVLGKTGKRFWQPESFDRVIRDDDEMRRVRRYISKKSGKGWPVRKRGGLEMGLRVGGMGVAYRKKRRLGNLRYIKPHPCNADWTLSSARIASPFRLQSSHSILKGVTGSIKHARIKTGAGNSHVSRSCLFEWIVGESRANTLFQIFQCPRKNVESRFSTLGGTGYDEDTDEGRSARHDASELMLVLSPK